MSDERTSAPKRTEPGIYDHDCEHLGCTKPGGWGFARGKTEPHWFCYEHKAEGERYIA